MVHYDACRILAASRGFEFEHHMARRGANGVVLTIPRGCAVVVCAFGLVPVVQCFACRPFVPW